jgi:hypothetical protein
MNAYSVAALIAVWATMARTHATATVGGVHVTLPALWLLAAAAILALAAMVLWLVRSIVGTDGWWLAISTAGAP